MFHHRTREVELHVCKLPIQIIVLQTKQAVLFVKESVKLEVYKQDGLFCL